MTGTRTMRLEMRRMIWPLLVATVVLVACVSRGGSMKSEFPTDAGPVTLELNDDQVTLTVPGAQHVDVTFKDRDGNPLPGKISTDGPAEKMFPLPRGASSSDVDITCEDEALDFGGFEVAQGGNGNRALAPLRMTRRWIVGCTSNFLDDETLRGFSHAVAATGRSLAEAKASFRAITGPGSPIPPRVRIDQWVDVRAGALDTIVTSALREPFAAYRIDVDGVVVADVETGLNAALQVLPNGWYLVASTLPSSLVHR